MKHAQKTKVFIDDVNVSNAVMAVDIQRRPGEADTAVLTMYVEDFEIDLDGALVINIKTRS